MGKEHACKRDIFKNSNPLLLDTVLLHKGVVLPSGVHQRQSMCRVFAPSGYVLGPLYAGQTAAFP